MASVFTDNNQRLLDKVKQTTERMMDELTATGTPKDPEKLEALNGIMKTLTNTIIQETNTNLRNKEIDTTAQLGRSMAIEALKLATSKMKTAVATDDPNYKPDFKTGLSKDKIVEGQLEQGAIKIDPNVVINVDELDKHLKEKSKDEE